MLVFICFTPVESDGVSLWFYSKRNLPAEIVLRCTVVWEEEMEIGIKEVIMGKNTNTEFSYTVKSISERKGDFCELHLLTVCSTLIYPVFLCLVLFCHVLSYIFTCPVISYPVLSCLFLSCPVLLKFYFLSVHQLSLSLSPSLFQSISLSLSPSQVVIKSDSSISFDLNSVFSV